MIDDLHDRRLALRADGLLAEFNRADVLAAADVHVATRLGASFGRKANSPFWTTSFNVGAVEMQTASNTTHASTIKIACFAVMSPRRLNSMEQPDQRTNEKTLEGADRG